MLRKSVQNIPSKDKKGKDFFFYFSTYPNLNPGDTWEQVIKGKDENTQLFLYKFTIEKLLHPVLP